MTRHPHFGRDASAQKSPTAIDSIVGGFVFVLAAMGLLVALSYPVAATALVASLALGAAILRVGVPALARELHGRVTELEVPGIGTVQIRVSAR